MSRGSRLAGHSTARTLAAVVGAPLTAVTVGVGIAAAPGPQALCYAVGLQLVVPLWWVLSCALPLARSGRVAWGICGLLALPAAASILLGSLS